MLRTAVFYYETMTFETPLVLITVPSPSPGKLTKRFDTLATTGVVLGHLRFLRPSLRQATVRVYADVVERLERLLKPIDAL